MTDIEIEIDGKKLTARPDQTVIQVADAAGIYIPRFCYHKLLSVAANCRMCLVEVEKSPKALPACATPVMPGMKVFTRSQKTIEAQRAVMEFLLINHPLDCPICDQGGECELQDLSMGYGATTSHYDECKRSVANENLGPLIATEMTRCILCTRCVRFGDEVAGLRELGVNFRGEENEIGTYVEQAITSEVSGNIIDLCPVGALTSKPYLYTARAWELDQAPSIAPHDCIGSNLNVHTRYGKVMRVVSRENMPINEVWLSDRDRFSYTGLYHADRVSEPKVKVNGEWLSVDWEKALEIATSALQGVIADHGADQLGALASPSSTTEELYLLQKLMRKLGSSNIDHRLREVDTKDQAAMPAFPGLGMPIAELEQCDAVLLIGSNLQKEQPLAATRVRKAALKKAAILAVNPVDYTFNFAVAAKAIVSPHHLPMILADILKELDSAETNNQSAKAIASQLKDKQKVCLILGAFAMHHEQASTIRYLAQQIANKTGATLSCMTDGANAAGAWLAGAIPHREAGNKSVQHPGLNAYDMLKNPRKGYVLLNVEPEFDCANATEANAALSQADFVVALSMYETPALLASANVILPIAAFTETSGSYINTTGEWQSFKGVAQPYVSSRPAWKVLRVLANFLNLDGFDFETPEQVKHEVEQLIRNQPTVGLQSASFAACSPERKSGLSRIGEVPIYAIDNIVRRAEPLQKAQLAMLGDVAVAKMHPETAKALGVESAAQIIVKQQAAEVSLPLVLDDKIAKDAVWVAGGIKETAALGDLMGVIEVQS